MPDDIRPLGAGKGTGLYWVKEPTYMRGAVGSLRLVAIDEYGEVRSTPIATKWDEAALTRAEAVQAHLASAVAEADRDLERRRKEAPKAQEERPPPMDPATQRFLDDDEGLW